MKNLKQLIIGLAIAGAALYYTLRNVSLGELAESFKAVDYIYLIPATVIIGLQYVFRVYRWQVLLSPFKQIQPSHLYSPMMVGFLGNILPARAGELFRAYLLGKKFDITFSGAFASIVVERLFDLVMLLGIFAWVFVFHADVISADITFSGVSVQSMAIRFGQFSAVVVLVLFLFVYLLLFHKPKLMVPVRWVTRHLPTRWGEKIEYLIDEFSVGLAAVRDGGALVKITLYSILVWAAIAFSFYPLYWAYDLQNKSIASVLLLTVMTCILITVLPTPAFLGSYNAGVLIALHEIMNETEIAAVSFSMVAWSLTFCIIFVGGFYFIVRDHLSLGGLMEAEQEAEHIREEEEHHRPADR